MEFKQWFALNEKAERTSSKVPLYPALYHTKQYSPLYHTPYAGDYPVWLHLKLQPYTWQHFDKQFAKDNPPKPDWPEMGENIPSHAETITHPHATHSIWKIPN